MMEVVESVFVLAINVALFVALLFVIWTAVAVLYRVIPDGRLKLFLFRVRGEPGAETPEHEQFAVKALIAALASGLVLFIFWLSYR